jgi:hypothetical protein
MYFPEGNVLVPAVTDPASKTPAFKSVSISLTADHSEPPATANGVADASGRRPLEVVQAVKRE